MPVTPAPPASTAEAGPPRFWPRFTSPLRSLAVTARLGRLVGVCFAVCFVTGLLSHYQYQPWSWLPEPAAPVWLYRVTQGLHVGTGIALIPLLLVKLWSVFPRLFAWPAVRSAQDAVERLSVFVLVSSAIVELVTGFLNTLDWYPWPWSFVAVHRFLAYVVVGSILLHIAIKLPDIKRGLHTPPALDGPDPEALSRRGLLVAAGTGAGLVAVVASAAQTITPLHRLGLLAARQPARAPQHVPVNKTAAQARVAPAAMSPAWTLRVDGPKPFVLTLEQVEELARHQADLPIACVEGWSVGANWRGLRLVDLVRQAGGTADSHVRLVSLERHGHYNHSVVDGPQVADALLATHLNGDRLDLDHGYPLRLIAPNRAGVLNTKWLSRIEVS